MAALEVGKVPKVEAVLELSVDELKLLLDLNENNKYAGHSE